MRGHRRPPAVSVTQSTHVLLTALFGNRKGAGRSCLTRAKVGPRDRHRRARQWDGDERRHPTLIRNFGQTAHHCRPHSCWNHAAASGKAMNIRATASPEARLSPFHQFHAVELRTLNAAATASGLAK